VAEACNEDPAGAEFVAVRAAVRRFGDPVSGGGPNQFDLVHDKQVHRLFDAGTRQQRPESLTRLASDVLSRDHRLMIYALSNFFVDPGSVPIFFAHRRDAGAGRHNHPYAVSQPSAHQLCGRARSTTAD